MTYVDGFVVPIPNDKVADYKKMARKAGKIWMEYGALSYFECMGDDVPAGKTTDFYRSVKVKEGETPWFSFIVYKTKRDRDAILKKIMADPRLKMYENNMPFDGKRMIFGGFKTIIEMQAD
jgi:uncharacterized protein YbaA (DUF1428 family)